MSTDVHLQTTLLADYAAYLRKHHLAEVAAANMRYAVELAVPVLSLFAHLSPDEMLAMNVAGMETFLGDLEAGRAYEAAAQSREAWERDELPGVPRDSLLTGDLVLIYAAQRRALMDYLSQYTPELATALAIVAALDHYYTEIQGEALAVFDCLRQEAATQAARAEAESHAAQQTAEEQQALAEELQLQQDELNRVHARLQTEHEQVEAEVERRTQELQAVNEELTAQAEELEAQQASLREAHELMARQHQFLDEVLDNVPGAVGDRDLDLVIRAANAPYLALVGKPKEDVLDHTSLEVFGAEQTRQIEGMVSHILTTGEAIQQHGVLDPLNKHYFDHTISAVRDRAGEVTGILSLSVDVTQRVTLEAEMSERAAEAARQQRLLEKITSQAPAGIGFLDTDLVVRWANPGFSRLFRREAVGFLDHPLLERVNSELATMLTAALQKVVRTGEPYTMHAHPYTRQDTDQPNYWDISYVPVPGPDGATDGLLLFALDVTQRVENEKLQHARFDELRQLDHIKDEFLAALSAQLVTPIHTVMGFASVLDEGAVGGALRPEQATYISRILATCQVQLALTNDLLDLGRFSAGKLVLDPAPLDLAATTQEMLTALEPLTRQQGQRIISFLPAGLPSVQGDLPRVEQVLTNFLHAASKLTPPGGQIRIEVKREDAFLRLEVQDAGPILTPEQISRALEQYAQLGGIWLGLSVARRIIMGQGGKLGIELRPGTGNVFWFTLPLA